MSLQELLREPEDRARSLKDNAELHERLAEQVHHLYMDNARSGTYQQPFDNCLEGYAMRNGEDFDSYCNRLIEQSEQLKSQAQKEQKEAENVEEVVIPQIVCDYQAGHRRRTPSMKKTFRNHTLCPLTEPEEKLFRNPV